MSHTRVKPEARMSRPHAVAARPPRHGVSAPALAMGLTAALTFVFTLAVLTVRPSGHPDVALVAAKAATPAPAAPGWVEVVRPFHMFDLAGGEDARLPLRYLAKRDPNGAARRDTLTYGTPVPGQRFIRITVARPGTGDAADSSLFVDVARSAAETGLAVVRSGLPMVLQTPFGPVETADMTVAAAEGRAACFGFRLAGVAPIALFGFGCGTRETPLSAADLACALSALDLVSAGDDEPLQRFFAEAARKRGMAGCAASRTAAAQGLTALHAAVLKGSIAE